MMKQSLPGFARRIRAIADALVEAADCGGPVDLDTFVGGYQPGISAHTAETLTRNLEVLRNRTMAGDHAALDEFFTIYVFDDAVEFKRPEASNA